MKLSEKYLSEYSTLFNRSEIINFINKIEFEKLNNLIECSKIMLNTNIKYNDFYDELYDVLKQNYRCEYIYLNEIFINEILKSHNNDSTVLTEFNINNSKADFIIINGTTTVYEIKTELDSLFRLEKQLLDYSKAFDHIYVVTYKEMLNNVKEILNSNKILKKVGIKILNSNGNLETLKESKSFIKNFDRLSIFNCLLKKERDFFDDNYYNAEKKFLKRSNIYIHNYFKECLKKRKTRDTFIEQLPYSLKMIGYKLQNKLNKLQKEKLYIKLNCKIKI